MGKTYLQDKQRKKKSAMKGVWVVVCAFVLFAFVIVKFAASGGISDVLSFGTMPNADDAYKIAKDYVTPTMRSGNVSFPDDHYQFGKKADSVFIIKSYVNTIDARGEKARTDFEVVLKYDGGPKQNKKNWTMIDINETSE